MYSKMLMLLNNLLLVYHMRISVLYSWIHFIGISFNLQNLSITSQKKHTWWILKILNLHCVMLLSLTFIISSHFLGYSHLLISSVANPEMLLSITSSALLWCLKLFETVLLRHASESLIFLLFIIFCVFC